ncbi:MAG TPA: hypothetical protein VM821_04850 [Abditibacteriaceae bacterium]|nr:hypothetical protein [Abditibacteriaceae bacterium]
MTKFESRTNLTESRLAVAPQAVYEAPRVETVLSAEDLEREVAYAGVTVQISVGVGVGVGGVGGGSVGGGGTIGIGGTGL